MQKSHTVRFVQNIDSFSKTKQKISSGPIIIIRKNVTIVPCIHPNVY